MVPSCGGTVAATMRLELSRRGDYAVRTMLALAAVASEPTRVSARRLADQMAIPARFLPHVLRDLAQAGLVEGRIGRNGGYRLAREPSRITLLEIVEAAEGNGGPPTCVLRGGPCRPDGRCAVHDPFAAARAAVRERLAATTLEDVPMDWETFEPGPRRR
jgi:Rrf2 family protein